MGNTCECVRRQPSGDEAEDALLASLIAEGTAEGRPRGPPPPYQVGQCVCVQDSRTFSSYTGGMHCVLPHIGRAVSLGIKNAAYRDRVLVFCMGQPTTLPFPNALPILEVGAPHMPN